MDSKSSLILIISCLHIILTRSVDEPCVLEEMICLQHIPLITILANKLLAMYQLALLKEQQAHICKVSWKNYRIWRLRSRVRVGRDGTSATLDSARLNSPSGIPKFHDMISFINRDTYSAREMILHRRGFIP